MVFLESVLLRLLKLDCLEIGCGPGPGKVMIAKFLTNTGVNKGPQISIKGRNFLQSLKRDGTFRKIFCLDKKLYCLS